MTTVDSTREHAIFSTVADEISDLVCIIDVRGILRYTNAAWRKRAGEGRLAFLDAVEPDERTRIDSILQKAFKDFSPLPPGTETRLLQPLGPSFAVSLHGVLPAGEDRMILIARDLTESRDVENRMRLLATALTSTRDAFCLNDLADTILFVNPAFCEIYGYTEEELIGRNIDILRVPSTTPDVFAEIRRATLTGGWKGEITNRRKDGTEFPIEIWTTMVRDDEGRPLGIAVSGRDITERKKSEERLRESTERLELTLDNINIIAWEIAPDGTFLLVRGKGLEKTGLRPDQLAGQSIFSLQEFPVLIDAFRTALSGATQTFEVEFRGVIWHANYIPLRDSTGAIERIFGTAIDVTERKRAEEALRVETELWHTLMDNIPDPIFYKDTRSRFTRINKAQAELLGARDVFDAIGKTDADFRPSPEESLADDRSIVQSGRPILGKVEKFPSQGGTARWFLTTKVPIRSEKGEITGIVGSSREITTLKNAEELEAALYRIAEETSSSDDMPKFFASIHSIIGGLMEASNFYIALYDREKDLLSFPYFVDEVDVPSPPSPPGRGLTAYVLRTGKTLLCDEKVLAELIRRDEAALVGAPSPIWLGVPLVGRTKTIGVMVVQHYSNPSAFGQREQNILEFVSSHVARAIEHKQDEEAVRQSESKYRTLFEESEDGILITTPEGTLIDVNTAGVELLGYSSRDELMKVSDVRSLYQHPEDRDRFISEIHSQGSVTDFEFVVKRKDGQPRIVLENATTVRDADGRILSIRAYLRDITQRKRLEEQLRQAQKLEGIGTLAGGIAHDFNNILGIVLGYATLLESNGSDRTRAAQCIDAIKHAVERGSHLVKELLTFARKSDPAFKFVDVNAMIRELSGTIADTFPQTLTIRTDLAPAAPNIIADSEQLHHALFNLCANARDAMLPAGGSGRGVLTLSTRVVTAEEAKSPESSTPFLAVSVNDTGIGMDEQTRRRIFEPFFTTKDTGQGTGLGLAVVYGVVKSHHGRIEVDSATGSGTTVTLFFPLPLAEPEGAAPEPARTSTETVLVVEDEEMLGFLLKNILEDHGYTVLTARDGQEGLSLYRKHSGEISVILSDMGLPKLGGWEMFQEMKKLNSNVKAILASGYFDPNLKLDLIRAGAKDFIQKPYVAESVLQRIREVIDEG